MSLFLPLVWSQAVPAAAGASAASGPGGTAWSAAIKWLKIWGDPRISDASLGEFFAHAMTWLKVLGWLSLVGWVAALAINSLKRTNRKWSWQDYGLLAGIALGAVSLFLGVAETNQVLKLKYLNLGPFNLRADSVVGALGIGLAVLWLESALWSSVLRLKSRRTDAFLLVAVHAMLALGVAVIVAFYRLMEREGLILRPEMKLTVYLGEGLRCGMTYAGLVILLRLAIEVFSEASQSRFRRLWAVAGLTIRESTRVMKAPWVVLAVFLVIIAFTHWFLQPPDDQRAAELSRLYVSAIMIVCTLLVCLMVCMILPLSLPRDIENQTIYTVVTKPVRRLELVWGRVLGVMTLVTIMLAVIGGLGAGYIGTILNGAEAKAEAQIKQAEQNGTILIAQKWSDELDQLKTRRSARTPIRGSLSFVDSKGQRVGKRGIDVGQEQEFRSHVEGATESAAIWAFGDVLEDPNDSVRRDMAMRNNPNLTQLPPVRRISRPIPVAQLLEDNTIEAFEDRFYNLKNQQRRLLIQANQPGVDAKQAQDLRTRARGLDAQIEAASKEALKQKEEDEAILRRARAADQEGRSADAQSIREESALRHAPDMILEMTFTIYRTTKGILTDPILASVEVTNPNRVPEDEAQISLKDESTGEQKVDPRSKPIYRKIFEVHEYYTNQIQVPAGVLTGSGGDLMIKVQCISPTQYLGMAESDLYILGYSGDFYLNFFKGLTGIWLQALVLTTIGVFVSTFLSWRVALVTTVMFFVAGLTSTSLLASFFQESVQGGGPFEAIIRIVTHTNLMTDLAPTTGVIAAKSFDAVAMPFLSALAFVIPNFTAFDFSTTVADGYAIGWGQFGQAIGLALAYALPFSAAGYFILKNREVAA